MNFEVIDNYYVLKDDICKSDFESYFNSRNLAYLIEKDVFKDESVDNLLDMEIFNKKNIIISDIVHVNETNYENNVISQDPFTHIYSLSLHLVNVEKDGFGDINFSELRELLRKHEFNIHVEISKAENKKCEKPFDRFLCDIGNIISDIFENYKNNDRYLHNGCAIRFENSYFLGGRGEEQRKYKSYGITKLYEIKAVLIQPINNNQSQNIIDVNNLPKIVVCKDDNLL